jgi:hypothetical protein
MIATANRLSSLTRRRLLLCFGSAGGAGSISPTLAAAASTVLPTGSENRVSQTELDRIVARTSFGWIGKPMARSPSSAAAI